MKNEKLVITISCFSLIGTIMIGCFIGDYFFRTKLLDDALLHTVIGGVLGFLGSHISPTKRNNDKTE